MERHLIKKPNIEGLEKARKTIEDLYKKEPSEELLKAIEDTAEYEEIECVDRLTGTIEIMRRRI